MGRIASNSKPAVASESNHSAEMKLELAALRFPVRIFDRAAVASVRASLSLPHTRIRTVLSSDRPCDFSSASNCLNNSLAELSGGAPAFPTPMISTNSLPSQLNNLVFIMPQLYLNSDSREKTL